MGKIKFNQVEIEQSVKHFKLAIEYNDNFECEHFKDIYQIIADIFYLNKDPLISFEKFEIYSKIYEIFKHRLSDCLHDTEILINELIKEEKISKYSSIIDFL